MQYYKLLIAISYSTNTDTCASYRCRSVVYFADRAEINYYCTGTGF